MSDVVDINTLNIGDTISFKTYNEYDTVERRAKLLGIANYDVVKKLEDLLPYYQEVKKTQGGMADIDQLTYFILDCYENSDNTAANKRVFAKEWIDVSTLRLINIGQHVDFRVYDVSSADVKKIQDIFSDYGYSISVIEDYNS